MYNETFFVKMQCQSILADKKIARNTNVENLIEK